VDCNRCRRRPAPEKFHGSSHLADAHRSRRSHTGVVPRRSVPASGMHAATAVPVPGSDVDTRSGGVLWPLVFCNAVVPQLLKCCLIARASDLSALLWCNGPQRLSRVTENQGSILEREPERWLPPPRRAAGVQLAQCNGCDLRGSDEL